MTATTTALTITKPSSDDDPSFRYGFRDTLSLTECVPAPPYNIDVTLREYQVQVDADFFLCGNLGTKSTKCQLKISRLKYELHTC